VFLKYEHKGEKSDFEKKKIVSRVHQQQDTDEGKRLEIWKSRAEGISPRNMVFTRWSQPLLGKTGNQMEGVGMNREAQEVREVIVMANQKQNWRTTGTIRRRVTEGGGAGCEHSRICSHSCYMGGRKDRGGGASDR